MELGCAVGLTCTVELMNMMKFGWSSGAWWSLVGGAVGVGFVVELGCLKPGTVERSFPCLLTGMAGESLFPCVHFPWLQRQCLDSTVTGLPGTPLPPSLCGCSGAHSPSPLSVPLPRRLAKRAGCWALKAGGCGGARPAGQWIVYRPVEHFTLDVKLHTRSDRNPGFDSGFGSVGTALSQRLCSQVCGAPGGHVPGESCSDGAELSRRVPEVG